MKLIITILFILLISFLHCIKVSAQPTFTIVDSASSLIMLRAENVKEMVKLSRQSIPGHEKYLSNWRLTRILTQLRESYSKPYDKSDCIASNLFFNNMAISHIFQVDKQLFFLIASPVHGWMPTSMMYEDMAQTKKLSHYDSLFSNLNKYDQFRFLNALNCGRYLDHYYVLILYDSSKGIRDIREEYSSEDIEISVNDSSFSLPIYSVEYANSSFGSPMYSRRLVVYQPSSDSLREAFNYEYVRYGFLDNELRLFDYSFNDKNIKLRGFVWYAGDTSLQFGPGYPDTTRLKPLYRRFDYDGKIFKQE